jgi:broad specificity phosphatase PhoE
MEVTCLRHSQSIFNRDLTSEKDCELSEFGIQQAEKIEGTYDVIICSILKRAQQTLEYSDLKCKHLYFTDLCREVRRDICDFLLNEDETKQETEKELQKRILEFKEFVQEKTQPGQKVLIICHRDFIHELNNKKGELPKNAEFIQIKLE